MKLKINGETKTIENTYREFSIEGFLEHLGYKPQLVVVELNGAIINPKDWMNTKIKNGDCLEVVTIVGGGSYS
tara:strand:- start:111 stop:329 length:219 start_codon:yes stop_codon:yes gene_type:complete